MIVPTSMVSYPEAQIFGLSDKKEFIGIYRDWEIVWIQLF